MARSKIIVVSSKRVGNVAVEAYTLHGDVRHLLVELTVLARKPRKSASGRVYDESTGDRPARLKPLEALRLARLLTQVAENALRFQLREAQMDADGSETVLEEEESESRFER